MACGTVHLCGDSCRARYVLIFPIGGGVVRHRAFNLLAILSLLLCLATGGLWSLSYFKWTELALTDGSVVRSWQGHLYLIHSDTGTRYVPFDTEAFDWRRQWGERWLGFERFNYTDYWSDEWSVLGIPHTIAIIPTLVLPSAWALGALRTRRRRKAGLCAACGYDLRATPQHCPECGVSPSSRSRRSTCASCN